MSTSSDNFNPDSDRNRNGNKPLPYRPSGVSPLATAPFNAELARLQRTLIDGDEKKNRLKLLDYLGLLWRGKWIILACLVVTGSLAAYYTYSLPFIYESSLQILVNEREQSMQLLASPSYWSNSDRELKKELQILTSRPILEKTAMRLMDLRYVDTSIKTTVLPVLSTAETKLAPRLLNSTPQEARLMMVDQLVTSLRKMITVTPSKDADIIQVTTHAGDPHEAALISNVYAEIYIADNLEQNSRKAKQMKQFVSKQMDITRDSLSKQEVDLKDYLESNGILGLDLQSSDLVAAKSKLENEAAQTQIEISTLSRKLQEAKRQYAEVDSSFSAEFASGSWVYATKLQEQIADLTVRKNLMNSKEFKGASTLGYENTMRQVEQQLALLKKELDSVVTKLKNSKVSAAINPGRDGAMPTMAVSGLKRQIFEDEIALQALKAQFAAINSAKGEIEHKISLVPSQELDVQRLQREKTALDKIYKELNEEYNKKVLEEQSVTPTARIFEPALPVLKPVSPNRTANIAVGIFIGLAIGVGIALLLAYSDTTVHSPDELEKNGFTVLTTIPLIPSGALNYDIKESDVLSKRLNGRASSHLITHIQPKAPIAEAYRSLRTAVQFAGIEEPARKILVASSVPQEGKSTTSTNLAITLAQSGARTLLIDCDLRRPTQNSVFGLPREPGLVNCLIGAKRLEEAIHPSGVPNLDILTSGTIPPNPSELIGSRRMREMLAELEEHYDMIIIDSPPVGAVTDAVILSTLADTTILVVRAHKTKMEFLEKAREGLERVNMPLLGVVLNDFDVSQSYGSASYRYYRYYRYYNYYGGLEEEDAGKDRKSRRAGAVLKEFKNETKELKNGV